jgi:hypothetical protein
MKMIHIPSPGAYVCYSRAVGNMGYFWMYDISEGVSPQVGLEIQSAYKCTSISDPATCDSGGIKTEIYIEYKRAKPTLRRRDNPCEASNLAAVQMKPT